MISKVALVGNNNALLKVKGPTANQVWNPFAFRSCKNEKVIIRKRRTWLRNVFRAQNKEKERERDWVRACEATSVRVSQCVSLCVCERLCVSVCVCERAGDGWYGICIEDLSRGHGRTKPISRKWEQNVLVQMGPFLHFCAGKSRSPTITSPRLPKPTPLQPSRK